MAVLTAFKEAKKKKYLQWVTPPHNIYFPRSVIPNQGFAERRHVFRHKLWNIYIYTQQILNTSNVPNVPRNVAGIFVR